MGIARRRRTARIRNTSVLLRADGDVAATYRKIHLFDVDVPGGMRFRESEAIEPGADVVVAETPWGGARPDDLLRPALPRALPRARRRAARACWPCRRPSRSRPARTTGTCCCARAPSRTRLYVFAPAQFGHHGGQRRSYGHAHGRRSRGARCSPSAATTRASRWRARLRLPGPACARTCPASRIARSEQTAS